MRVPAMVWPLLAMVPVICSGAQACSPSASYRVPSNLELVEQADMIVLARVVDNGPSEFESFSRMGGHGARLVPFRTLKGDHLIRKIVFPDAVLALPSGRLRATPSDPRNLVDANPDAFSGSCNRYVFRKGMIVVAFLKRDRMDYVPFAPAFSRALEDVPTSNALWVKAVRMYVAIAAMPKSMRRQAMRRQMGYLNGELNDPDSRLLALELGRTLGNPKH